MTREEFEAAYTERAGMSVDTLRWYGRFTEPCACGDEFCDGWAMGYAHDEALLLNEDHEALR